MTATGASATYPEHINSLLGNIEEVTRLIDFHVALTGKGPGRRHDVEVLNKSAVVLTVACWEAFVEEVATKAFDAMLNAARDPSTFPNRVLVIAGKELKDGADPRPMWSLAGNGWRNVLVEHKDAILKETVGNLNTPRPPQVDNLFEQVIGLKGLSAQWHWKGMSNQKALDALNDLVTLRGDIAHRVKAASYVTKPQAYDSAKLVQCLAAITTNRVGQYVHSRTGTAPWIDVRFGDVS